MDLLSVTIGGLLNEVAARFPGNECLVDLPGRRRYVYRDFLSAVNRLARGFLRLGVNKGDHLALWAPNLSEWVVTEFALMKIGAVLVSVDMNAQAQQLEYLLHQSDARGLITAEGLQGSEYIDIIRRLCPETGEQGPGPWRCGTFPELQHLVSISKRKIPGFLAWEEIMEMGNQVPETLLAQREASCRPEDVATILYTSGTTGTPKGVMSSHYGVVNTTLCSAENQKLTDRDRLCLSVPLSHMFGCLCVTLASVIKGAALVIPSRAFDPAAILEAVAGERCTALYGSPSAFIALMEDRAYRALDTRSLRTGIMGGAQCPMEVMKRVVEEMGLKDIVIGYGQTESSSWITQTHPEDPLDLRVSTVGRPLPAVEVKIIDPSSGEKVATGAVGEVCARGFNMKGYYKMPAATSKALDPEGWLHTGDLGNLDGPGYLRTSGRLTEVINKGGEMIYPTEIEEVLFAHPKISTAQVFGIPGRSGEEVAVWIKLEEEATATSEGILQYCRERLPASHLPAYIKFVKEFPMTPLGKIQKFKMKEMAIRELGLE
jgi:fatty-acyl-CoA synthase